MLKRIALVTAGLALVAAFGIFLRSTLDSSLGCDVCYRPMHEETFYRIHLADGETMDVCCPRCGLRFQEGRRDVVRAEVTDFYTKDRMDADKAFYVENSPVHLQPLGGPRGSLWHPVRGRLGSLPTESHRIRVAGGGALKFQNQNGGDVKTYAELLAKE